jgi:hypothetical protein
MSEQTDTHEWIIPTIGDDEGEWGQILNDFITGDLENEVPIQDTLANRPAADSSTPSLFVSTDEPALYYNDGSSWNEVSPPLTQEEVEDFVGGLVSAGNDIGVTYDDAGNSLIISLNDNIETDSISNSSYNESVISGDITGTTGIDLSAANSFDHTLTGDVTFTFDNATSSPPGNSFTILLTQDSTGGHTITWPSSVVWHGNSTPSPPADGGEKVELTFRSYDGGSSWYGSESWRAVP